MDDILKQLNEISLSGVAKKQKDITKLFPTFHDRVKSVGNMGGVRLSSLKSNVWEFKIHSGTDSSKWYDVQFHIKDIVGLVQKHAANKELWTSDGMHVDLRKVAHAIFFDADVQTQCSCPSFVYHGFSYISSRPKYDLKYGKKENRPPNVRNPHQHGIICKHLTALLKVLPFYLTSIAKWLKKYYAKEIKAIQNQVRKEEEVKTRPELLTKPEDVRKEREWLKGKEEEEVEESKKVVEKFEDIFKPPSDEEAKEREKRWLERKFDKSKLIDNGDGTYDYNGDLTFYNMGLTSLLDLPYRLRRVGGDFYCDRNKLKSLKGAPEKVGRDFSCSYNKLTALEGAPEYVGGDFWCTYNNQLTTLEGAPEKVGGDFRCTNNQLTSLEGAPREVGGYFSCSYNKLTTLEGAPEKVGGNFSCSYNKLTTLEGAPEEVGGYFYYHSNSASEEELLKTVDRDYLK